MVLGQNLDPNTSDNMILKMATWLWAHRYASLYMPCLRHTQLTPQGFVLLDAGVAITNQQQYTAAVSMGLVMARRPKGTLSLVRGLL